MHRLALLIATVLLLVPPIRAQSPSDSQTLQALLEEVRQLRQDLRNTTASLERAQILMHRIQFQESVVERAVRSLDEARTKVSQIQSARKNLAADVKMTEDRQTNSTNPVAQKDAADLLPRLKARLDTLQSEEQESQAAVTDREGQLRLEQAKLSELQDKLDQLETSLKNPQP
jgi:DNA repair exonuclease SbcCD ATPase subunit